MELGVVLEGGPVPEVAALMRAIQKIAGRMHEGKLEVTAVCGLYLMTDLRRCRVEERQRSPRNDETARIDANAREALLTAVFRRAKALRARSPASVCARLVEGNGPTELQSLIDQLDGAWFDYAVASIYTLLLPVERRKPLGAYFTPPHLVSHLMTRLEAAGLDLLLHRVHDPAAGGAAFVVPLVDAVAGQLLRSGWLHGAVLRELCRRFSGVELDKGLAHIANALLRRMLRISGSNASPCGARRPTSAIQPSSVLRAG